MSYGGLPLKIKVVIFRLECIFFCIVDYWDYFKKKKLSHSEGNSQQSKKATYYMGEDICNDISDKGSIS